MLSKKKQMMIIIKIELMDNDMESISNQPYNAHPAIISLTEAAVERVNHLIAHRNKPTLGIRVSVRSGGCSGLKYKFEYVDEKKPADEEVSFKGVRVFIDPKAILHLVGTTLDFKDEVVRSGFVFINPNEKGKCGCGESFYT